MGSLINKEELKVKAIKVINENDLIFIEDVCAMCGISAPTFYDKFHVDSNDFKELRQLLDSNKINLKVKLRKKWLDSDNATTQLALYKLCSTTEEHKKLQQNYTEVSGELNTSPLTTEEIQKAKESFSNEL